MPESMLFAFRGIRAFQALLAIATLSSGVGAVLVLKGYADGGPLPLLFGAIILGAVFLWAFATTLRAPTSFVAVAPERTRIRFAGFVDTVVANDNIVGARLRRRNVFGGVGVRTNFSGDVALVSTWGEAVEITFRQPIRVWLVPRLIPLGARRLTLSLRNPQKFVERFGRPAASPAAGGGRRMKARGSRTR